MHIFNEKNWFMADMNLLWYRPKPDYIQCSECFDRGNYYTDFDLGAVTVLLSIYTLNPQFLFTFFYINYCQIF